MSAASLASRMRYGFPKESVSEAAYRTDIEYVGLASDLRSQSPKTYLPWGSFNGIVIDSRLEPLEGTEWAILTVIVEQKFDGGEFGFDERIGTKLEDETVTEIDWATPTRALREHPVFNVNGAGAHKLTKKDLAELQRWERMPHPDYKKDYIYALSDTWDYAYNGSDGTETLSANAKLLAYGMMMGIDYYHDKVPIARKIETFVNGPSPKGKAGLKETPTGIPNLPEGYDWIREADRCVKKGAAGRWERSIEWLGVKKVLIDAEKIYWTEGDL